MSRLLLIPLVLLVLLAGCGGSTPTAAPVPSSVPSSAGAPGSPVSLTAADGTALTGRLFGAAPGPGAMAVVLSNMGDNNPAHWERLAPALAARGATVLTYAYRYPVGARSITTERARGALDDLRGAVAYLRAAGVTRIVLVGASLGGMVTAKAAGALKADAVAIVAAPAERTDFDLRVEPAELAALTGPKLFVASERDPNVPLAETRGLYDRAPEPRRWHAFASSAHGTQLLDTPLADDFTRLLVEFATGA